MKSPDTSNKRILIVEDEPAIRELCSRILTAEGFNVDTVANGKEGEDKLKERQDYGLIILDIRLPLMDGIQFYERLKRNHPQLIRRVIFTTGSVANKDTLDNIEQSGRVFLPKPFTAVRLRTKVREALLQIEK